jgi:hypothetical protein
MAGPCRLMRSSSEKRAVHPDLSWNVSLTGYFPARLRCALMRARSCLSWTFRSHAVPSGKFPVDYGVPDTDTLRIFMEHDYSRGFEPESPGSPHDALDTKKVAWATAHDRYRVNRCQDSPVGRYRAGSQTMRPVVWRVARRCIAAGRSSNPMTSLMNGLMAPSASWSNSSA